MGKRFTSTEKWQKRWFRKLSPKHKALWYYLTENCDVAGIWEIDFDMASFCIGSEILEEDLTALNGHVEKLSETKIYLTKFVEFQYGELKESCRPHRPIIAKLERINKRVSKPFPKGIKTLEDMDMDKDKEKDKDKKRIIKEKKPLIYPYTSDQFMEQWTIWKEYKKKEFNFAYKSNLSEQAALKKLASLSSTEDEAIQLLHTAMSNGWKGFFAADKTKETKSITPQALNFKE